uniref:Retroelement n=1 Tax=Aster yellows phytoplasma TaxID=35779 RepID=Q847N6_ASTYP|nr:retroelement [Aster yellows phytoplasma]
MCLAWLQKLSLSSKINLKKFTFAVGWTSVSSRRRLNPTSRILFKWKFISWATFSMSLCRPNTAKYNHKTFSCNFLTFPVSVFF